MGDFKLTMSISLPCSPNWLWHRFVHYTTGSVDIVSSSDVGMLTSASLLQVHQSSQPNDTYSSDYSLSTTTSS